MPFEDGEPTGSYENFLVNFWVEGDDRAVVWGRPADVAFLPSGAMLVADDTGGTIWHVAPADGAPEPAEAAEGQGDEGQGEAGGSTSNDQGEGGAEAGQ